MKTFLGRVLAVIIGIGIFFGIIFLIIMAIGAMFGASDEVKTQPSTVLTIQLNKPIIESEMEIEPSIFNLEGKPSVHLLELIKAIEKAKTDNDIKGISIELGTQNPGGITQIKNLRDALSNFKESGKFIYAYTNAIDQKGYYLSSVADSIFHNPMGLIEFKGLASEILFYKNLGEKFGVEFEVIRHGKYKSAVEPFIRENLSPENREQIQDIISGIWDGVITDISVSRKISKENINLAADSLSGIIAQNAMDKKLVDVFSQKSDYTDFLKSKTETKEEDKLKKVSLFNYATTVKNNYSKDKIAVLYASGMILPGDGQTGIQSETYLNAIQKITDDEKIKAVVLRINSGGGDAVTSEEILHALKKLHEKKPIIVSFGDVAASGGYYIAMENDGLLVEPSTVTGSIGVLGMMPNVEKLTQNLGITTDYVTSNPNANFYSPLTGLTPHAKAIFTENVEVIYNKFINHVADGRKLSVAQVDSLGGGHVYTGKKAVELGLADRLGSLSDAVELAAQKSEIEEYQLKSYPIKKNDLESILAEMNLSVEIKNQLKTSTNPELWKIYTKIDQLQKLSGTQMLMPFDLEVE